MSIRLKLRRRDELGSERGIGRNRLLLRGWTDAGHSPGVGFGQVVGVGIDLMDGEEPGSCSTCTTHSSVPWLTLSSHTSGFHQYEVGFMLVELKSTRMHLLSGIKRNTGIKTWVEKWSYLVTPWSLAAEPWKSQSQTAAAGLSVPHQKTPRPSKTTWRCCCRACSVSAWCLSSSQRCRSFPSHTQSAGGRWNSPQFNTWSSLFLITWVKILDMFLWKLI